MSRPYQKTTDGASPAIAAPQALAALVPMRTLLTALGFHVNTGRRRAPCLLHGGDNPTSFSWRDDGRWFCFACGRGGDAISLVREVKACSFREALAFLSALAGVPFRDDPSLIAGIRERQRQTAQLERAAQIFAAKETSLRQRIAAEVRDLERLRANAAARLVALDSGDAPRFVGERVLAWAALELVAHDLPRWIAAHAILTHGSIRSRWAFVVRGPGVRRRMIEQALARGFVLDEPRRQVEVAL